MHGHNRLFHHIVSQNSTAVSEVAHLLGDDRARAEKLFDLGSIYFNKKRVFTDVAVVANDYLRIHSEPRRYEKPTDIEARVLLDDPWFTIFDKPPGIPCHATVDNVRENLLAWWKEIIEDDTWITHRLDVATSGCLVVAKSSEASARFNRLIIKGTVEKNYEALVEGEVTAKGLITHWMVDDPWGPRIIRDYPFEGGLECRMHILSSEVLPNFAGHPVVSRVQLRLETGRTHQIRAQMAMLGHPLLNDEMYKARRFDARERIGLCARSLNFRHPFTGEELRLRAPRSPEENLILPT